MTAMERAFRDRGGLPWWYWRMLANRKRRQGGGEPVEPSTVTADTIAITADDTTHTVDES